MARPKTIISKSQLAKELRLSRARITQMCQMEGFPVRSDGRINRSEALDWHKSRGLDQQTSKRGPKPKSCSPTGSPSQAQLYRALEKRKARLQVLREIAAPFELLVFGRVALRMGCSPEQARALAMWYSTAPALALKDICSEDLEGLFIDPSPEQWVGAIGEIDFDASNCLYDSVDVREAGPAAAGG
jgi:hypothetical protein